MPAASRSRKQWMNRRRHGVDAQLKLLAEGTIERTYDLLFKFTDTRGWFIGRSRETPGGPLVDKLLLDESMTITETLVKQIVAIELVTRFKTTRYALDGGFIIPTGRERRFIATVRSNLTDTTTINV